MRSLAEIRHIIQANNIAGRATYVGLESAEIGRYNRAVMFGENDEARPDPTEWSRIVD